MSCSISSIKSNLDFTRGIDLTKGNVEGVLLNDQGKIILVHTQCVDENMIVYTDSFEGDIKSRLFNRIFENIYIKQQRIIVKYKDKVEVYDENAKLLLKKRCKNISFRIPNLFLVLKQEGYLNGNFYQWFDIYDENGALLSIKTDFEKEDKEVELLQSSEQPSLLEENTIYFPFNKDQDALVWYNGALVESNALVATNAECFSIINKAYQRYIVTDFEYYSDEANEMIVFMMDTLENKPFQAILNRKKGIVTKHAYQSIKMVGGAEYKYSCFDMFYQHTHFFRCGIEGKHFQDEDKNQDIEIGFKNEIISKNVGGLLEISVFYSDERFFTIESEKKYVNAIAKIAKVFPDNISSGIVILTDEEDHCDILSL